MKIRLSVTALAVASAVPALAFAASSNVAVLSPVVVSSTGIETVDVDATYASEVHTREDIQRSGAVTLLDYLSRYTSVTATPNFGNRFTPTLDMRGYGLSAGHQNVAVSVNGRRLNNIDMAPPLLGSIPLSDIERIEITKGSGSVLNGDGAMAGAIRIITRPRTGAQLNFYAGSHGAFGLSASAGLAKELFSFSASAEKTKHAGYSKKDPSGSRDKSTMESWAVNAEVKPVDAVRLGFDAGKTRIDTRYPRPLSLAQFKANPAQNPGSNYTHQDFTSDHWQLSGEFDLSSTVSLVLRHSNEDKVSEFSTGWSSEYDYRSTDVTLNYREDALWLSGGHRLFDGRRTGGDNKTDKDSKAWFIQGQYEFDRFVFSAGWRKEAVSYAYRPTVGATLKDDESFSSWDLGLNYRFDEKWTSFVNYNSAFHAPDVDRFFVWGGGFNAFIAPAQARTLTVGLNRVDEKHRLKFALFHSRLRDEIYYNAATWTNTNLDRSRKYGLEAQGTWLIDDRFTASLNYQWTRATIVRDSSGGGAYNGKDLPGVSRHALTASVNVRTGEHGSLNIAHAWRSKAFAANDFSNNFSQKQRPYHSTDVSYRHRVRDELTLFASVDNVFARKNGVWVRDNAIYPFDFSRTWRVGANLTF